MYGYEGTITFNIIDLNNNPITSYALQNYWGAYTYTSGTCNDVSLTFSHTMPSDTNTSPWAGYYSDYRYSGNGQYSIRLTNAYGSVRYTFYIRFTYSSSSGVAVTIDTINLAS